MDFSFDQLTRWPDLEAPDLQASDSADRLLLSHAEKQIALRPELREQPLAIVGDSYGALSIAAAVQLGFTDIRVHQDARSGELARENNQAQLSHLLSGQSVVPEELVPELVAGASLVLMRLPRSLDQLEHWAALVAAHAQEDVVLLAAGRIKHMTKSMNEVLGKYFDQVTASLAHQKSRVLTATGPRRAAAQRTLISYPMTEFHKEVDLTVCAYGGVFAGTSIDIGTRELLAVLDHIPEAQHQRIIDFGCGTGILAARVAQLRPTATVIATDQSWAAVKSAQATLRANNLESRVSVVRDDGLSSQADESADLILFNPPFHSGAAVHAGTSLRLFAEAGRVLKQGGELWVVANRHLGYKQALHQVVGKTTVVHRSPKFTVTRSLKA